MLTTTPSTRAAAPSSFAVAQPQRRAFTLIELLIVISILAILASIMLFALVGAEGSAKVMRTQSTVMKLHNIVMQKYDSYRTRRVPINVPPSFGRVAAANVRLTALREIMRLEMPDRYSDLVPPLSSISIPSLAVTYRRTYARLAEPYQDSNGNGIWDEGESYTDLNNNNAHDPENQYQGAECLYLLVSLGIDDPDLLSQFSAADIGDVDHDGFKEFLDAWGKPISFLRWAPGFESPLQPRNATAPFYSEHDPFDTLQVFKPTTNTGDAAYYQDFAQSGVHPPLFPLIYSAGPDGVYDMTSDSPVTRFYYTQTAVGSSPTNNPYFPLTGSSGKFLIGSFDDSDSDGDNRIDNITNHDLASP